MVGSGMDRTRTRRSEQRDLDCVVVGAGPAGLQLSHHLAAAGIDVVLLESAPRVGSFFTRYPRNRQLISFNKRTSTVSDFETNLRWDWNSLLSDDQHLPFLEYSHRLYPLADELLHYLDDYAKVHEIPVLLNTRASRVERAADGAFLVRTDDAVYRSRYVVMTTGAGRPHVPGIPGIELAEGYESVALSKQSFAGKRVLVIGKGNSAIEVCDDAVESAAIVHLASPGSLRLAHRTRHAGGVRVHNARILDLYQLKTLHSILDCTVERIDRAGPEYRVEVAYSHADGERDVLCYDRVVRCAGFDFDDSVFDPGCAPRLSHDGRLPAMTATWESTNVPDLFFAGTLMQARDFRGAGSAFINGFRYNIRTLSRMLAQRYHSKPFPVQHASADPAALADLLTRRASTSSALWIQFNHLCDVVVPGAGGTGAEVYPEWPVQDLGRAFGRNAQYYTLHFQWGRLDGDPYAVPRHPAADRADSSVFLHPVVRRYAGAQMVGEHHLLEDLTGVYHPDSVTNTVYSHNGVRAADYHRREHVEPLRSFLRGVGQRR